MTVCQRATFQANFRQHEFSPLQRVAWNRVNHQPRAACLRAGADTGTRNGTVSLLINVVLTVEIHG